MANLPYFKFNPSVWLTGDINDESDNIKGVFITICAHYWNNNCDLSIAKLKRKVHQSKIKAVQNCGFIQIKDDKVFISFLDEQYSELADLHNKRSAAGRAGAIAKHQQTDGKRTTLPSNINKDKEEDKDITLPSSDVAEKNWRTDFEVYKQELESAYSLHLNDPDWITEREGYHGSLDVRKSLKKAVMDYWIKPEGWKKKKSSKSVKLIDWRATFNNALTIKSNQVYKQKTEGSTTPGLVKVLPPTKNHRDNSNG